MSRRAGPTRLMSGRSARKSYTGARRPASRSWITVGNRPSASPRNTASACCRDSRAWSVVPIPPITTGMPRARYSSATSHARGIWHVSIAEMATTSAFTPKSISCTCSSVNEISTCSGTVAAKQTGPCGGRWYSGWLAIFGHFG